ncbi:MULTISPECIES: N4-gp56 family major capsid protein [unclassified Peribacillus]|uniref:N4-gp56 family major capsid protein n=1 Tax=unclassified Peribacillus TaxID=2675266 RepID=UPI00366D23B6
MPTNINSYSNGSAGFTQLTAEQAEVYQRLLLERLTPELFFMKYGEKNMGMPKNAGDTASWRRWNSLAVATTAVTEGVTPDGVSLDVTKISATVKQYGNWTKFTDKIQLVGLDNTLVEVTELMGENAGESLDIVVRDIITAGTNVVYPGVATSRATVTAAMKITALDILRIRRNLKRNKVKTITLPGGGKGYLAFIHTDVATDLMQTQEWKDQNTYVDTKNRVEGTLGKMYGIYFIEADNAPKFAGAGSAGADVFGTLVIGKGAYGVPDVEGSAKPEIIVHKAGSAGTADPMNQFNTVAWKACLTALRLNELCIARYESSASL